VPLLSEKLRKNLRISQQARVEDCVRVSEAYAEMGIRADVKPFFQDISERINQAQLVISRSGASSVADISIIGRPSILVPLAAAIRDEQTANARELVESGAAILLPEDQFTPEQVACQIQTILDDGNRAQNMANAALACAKPTATVDISNMIQDFDRDI
jgi:UDP-N-acetylglucosamine--N-acetylmuramyl-(pentapeptide) pyrophosphoryl-undecaprenol N-acetylglucosamine transferase